MWLIGVPKLRTCTYVGITYVVITRTELDYRLILIISFHIDRSMSPQKSFVSDLRNNTDGRLLQLFILAASLIEQQFFSSHATNYINLKRGLSSFNIRNHGLYFLPYYHIQQLHVPNFYVFLLHLVNGKTISSIYINKPSLPTTSFIKQNNTSLYHHYHQSMNSIEIIDLFSSSSEDSVATPIHSTSRRIRPSGPYLHLSKSGILHQVDTSSRILTFTRILVIHSSRSLPSETNNPPSPSTPKITQQTTPIPSPSTSKPQFYSKQDVKIASVISTYRSSVVIQNSKRHLRNKIFKPSRNNIIIGFVIQKYETSCLISDINHHHYIRTYNNSEKYNNSKHPSFP